MKSFFFCFFIQQNTTNTNTNINFLSYLGLMKSWVSAKILLTQQVLLTYYIFRHRPSQAGIPPTFTLTQQPSQAKYFIFYLQGPSINDKYKLGEGGWL